MFHHYSENNSSTGEPPTPPSSNLLSTPVLESQAGPSQRQPRGSSRSLNAQEPDSGYEASPSSLADNNSCTLHFFGEQEEVAVGAHHAVGAEAAIDEDELQDSVFLMVDPDSDEDIDEWDLCPDCNSVACCSCYRNDSSVTTTTSEATAVAVGELCDNSSLSSDPSSSNRPSSQPIQIPQAASRGAAQHWPDSPPQLDLRLRPSRSQPLDFPRHGSAPWLRSFSFVTGSHPLSWPSTAAHFSSQRGFFSALPLVLADLSTARWEAPHRTRRPNRQVRSRRRLIDSDASSQSSSEDGLDLISMRTDSPVFELSDSPMLGLTNGSGPLPDLVLGANSPATSRRSRSISVNLPPEIDNIREVGRSLRRLSEQFEQIRIQQCRRARRMTIGDVIHFNRAS